MSILVTGGAGFIGSHIVDAYVEAGHRVVVIDDLSSGKREQVHPKAAFHEMDILSPDVERVLAEENIEIVNHHAAQISVTASVSDPERDARVNILGSLNLLRHAAARGVKKFIFASTGGALYGMQERYPADENHPVRPISPYGISKYCVENYLAFFHATHGLTPIILRYSNVFGPRQDPHGEAGVVAIFSDRFLNDTAPTIFGDGKQTRDFISVFDVVRANVRALSCPLTGAHHISTGKETSVNELCAQFNKLTGKNLTPRHEPARPGEVDRSVLDAGRFRKAAGWQAEDTLESGLKKTYEYFFEKAAAS